MIAPPRLHVVLIDDDPHEVPLIARSLQPVHPDDPGVDLVPYTSVAAAIDRVLDAPPDLILLDHRLPPSCHFAESLGALRRHGCLAPVVVISNCVPMDASHPDVLAFLDKFDIVAARIAALLVAEMPYGAATDRFGRAAAASQKQEIA